MLFIFRADFSQCSHIFVDLQSVQNISLFLYGHLKVLPKSAFYFFLVNETRDSNSETDKLFEHEFFDKVGIYTFGTPCNFHVTNNWDIHNIFSSFKVLNAVLFEQSEHDTNIRVFVKEIATKNSNIPYINLHTQNE